MIELSSELKAMDQVIKLGVLKAEVVVRPSRDEYIIRMKQLEKKIQQDYTLENYRTKTLEASRILYKKLGKDPSRYRISSDSLMRRLIKNKGLYYVNNVVDINNVISLKTLWSIGAYDLEKIEGPIIYGVGQKDEPYEGIGRGLLNIEHLPVLRDDLGSFGSATSDTLRTMVTENTTQVLLVIHAFGGDFGLQETLDEMQKSLEEFAEAKHVVTMIL